MKISGQKLSVVWRDTDKSDNPVVSINLLEMCYVFVTKMYQWCCKWSVISQSYYVFWENLHALLEITKNEKDDGHSSG